MKQGFWVKKDIDGNKIYEGYFVDNIPVGKFTRFHKNGVVKADMLYDSTDNKQASVKLFDDTGELSATGAYYDKKKDGEWKYFGSQEKLVMQEMYNKGLKNGIAIKYYPSGKIVEELEWKNGKMNGKWNRYYEDGTIRIKSMHNNDMRTGDFIVYYPDKKIELKGAYKNDLKEGKWIFYSPKGVVEKEMEFVKGIAKNQELLDAQLAKELDDIEKNKGKLADPSEFMDNPMEYFQGSGQ
jgi:antitoxin component YwqK of YwqJK toxin-antitoxin module